MCVALPIPVRRGAHLVRRRPHGAAGFGRPRAPASRHGSPRRRSVALDAHAYCFGNGCSDGVPPTTPPDVGSPAKVRIDFPLDDWSILRPVGHAGTYDATLFGRGGGDLVTVFRWSTPADGPLSDPEAQLAVLADHDGEVDSYGVELGVSNLAATPERSTATITVTAANNRSLTFEATPSTQGCLPEGTVAWNGPDREGLAAAQLGPRPFTYRVVLTLDDARHVATASWPRDEIQGNEPSVGLRFARHCRRCDRNPENVRIGRCRSVSPASVSMSLASVSLRKTMRMRPRFSRRPLGSGSSPAHSRA